MAERRFVSTTSKDRNARIVVEVKFVSTTREGLRTKIVAGAIFVSITREDHYAKIAIPLDTLLMSHEAVSILP